MQIEWLGCFNVIKPHHIKLNLQRSGGERIILKQMILMSLLGIFFNDYKFSNLALSFVYFIWSPKIVALSSKFV